MIAFSFMSWFNRVCMAVAGSARIMDEFHISTVELGTIHTAMLLAYALCMTPGGWLIDRKGAWFSLAVMGIGSGVFVALTGVAGAGIFAGAWVVSSFLVIRALMGAFTAPIYPACGRLVSHWLPFPQRSGMNGLIQGAAPLGIACAPLVFGYLIDQVGWRWAFLSTGIVTVVLGLLWTGYATDHPAQHPSVNQAELEWIGKEEPPTVATANSAGWRILLRNRSLMLLTLSYAMVGYFEYLFFFWMDYYFENVLKLEPVVCRTYAALPPLAMVVGMPLGGWVSDRLMRAGGYRFGRVSVPVFGMITGAALLFLGASAQEPAWIVTWFTLALGACGMVEGPFWTTGIDLGGRRGGTAAGILNTGGNAGGLIAPVVTPWVGIHWGWYWALVLGSAICMLGVGLWAWIDPAERVREDA
jgi:MFS family permease